MRLFSYKMTDDTGFAPNPFWGHMTLVTCKPGIRKSKHPEDWIAGFTSKELCGDPVGGERLIFLMEVEEKMTLANYWRNKRFRLKIPRLAAQKQAYREGDNIYRPRVSNAREPGDFAQLPNPNHTSVDQIRDVGGAYALISRHFVYFGIDALPIPPDLRPEVPRAQSNSGSETGDIARARGFIDYVLRKGSGVKNRPHQWPLGDDSWHRSHSGKQHPIEGIAPEAASRKPASRQQPGSSRAPKKRGCGTRR